MKSLLRRTLLASALIACSHGQGAEVKPKVTDLAQHAYPALGGSAPRKVSVEWNRFYDTDGLGSILAQLHAAFPKLTKVHSLGKSYAGKEMWCLEVSAFDQGGDPARKPGMYIDGNIHGNEVQGGETVAYTAWYLCHQYGRLPEVTDLLDHSVFYLVPTINPDGRDRWLHSAHNPHTSRSGVRPYDNDGDGLFDEDDYDDLDGDGHITQMRIKDPNGRYKKNLEHPDYLMTQVAADEKGEYTLLGWEGIDNDGDGQINEDPVGGYDPNRDWHWDWQPAYIQPGAMEYPGSLPETRNIVKFFLGHPNIAAFQSFHNFGGMILRSPGREGGNVEPQDESVLSFIAQRGEKMLPYYRSMVIYKDLYTVWGGEVDWLYSGRGIIGFTSEIWNPKSLGKTGATYSQEEDVSFIKYVLMNDGVVKWHPYKHPTYGDIEIGGFKKEWGRTPPSFLLEEECHRNMAFTLYHAAQMPRPSIQAMEIKPLGEKVFQVRLTLENKHLIPTRTGQDVKNHISPPDTITFKGANSKVIAAGLVQDPYFNKVEAITKRPERIQIDTIPGMGVTRVQFIVSGTGTFDITVDTARGGVVTTNGELK